MKNTSRHVVTTGYAFDAETPEPEVSQLDRKRAQRAETLRRKGERSRKYAPIAA